MLAIFTEIYYTYFSSRMVAQNTSPLFVLCPEEPIGCAVASRAQGADEHGPQVVVGVQVRPPQPATPNRHIITKTVPYCFVEKQEELVMLFRLLPFFAMLPSSSRHDVSAQWQSRPP